MYLSKIHIPWQQAKNSYDLHKALWRLFPGREKAERDFLFRVENQQKGLGAQVLMQSVMQPKQVEQSPIVLDWRDVSLKLKRGQRLRFHLRANPIKAIKDSNKGVITKNGKIFSKTVRVPLLREEQQQTWIKKKLQAFSQLDIVIVQPEPVLYFRKTKEERSGKIQTVLFDGILTLTEPKRFIEQLQKGIGPAKAFGCGLLSIGKV